MDLKSYIESLRTKAGKNKADFARALGMNASLLSRYESGEVIPGKEFVDKLQRTFHANTEILTRLIAETETERDADRIWTKWTGHKAPRAGNGSREFAAKDPHGARLTPIQKFWLQVMSRFEDESHPPESKQMIRTVIFGALKAAKIPIDDAWNKVEVAIHEAESPKPPSKK